MQISTSAADSSLTLSSLGFLTEVEKSKVHDKKNCLYILLYTLTNRKTSQLNIGAVSSTYIQAICQSSLVSFCAILIVTITLKFLQPYNCDVFLSPSIIDHALCSDYSLS